jgi:hypothetical protein
MDLQLKMPGSSVSFWLELKGQIAFINSDTLPTQMDEISRRALEIAGVNLGEVVPDDQLFTFAKLPKDWNKAKTADRLKTELRDEKKRTRAVIIYKESFTAEIRTASITALSRFSYEIDWNQLEKTGLVVAVIKDAGKIIQETLPLPANSPDSRLSASNHAKRWLDEHYPGWEDPASYWDNDHEDLVPAS